MAVSPDGAHVYVAGTVDDAVAVFEIEADGFLRYMVRNIVGTLAQVD